VRRFYEQSNYDSEKCALLNAIMDNTATDNQKHVFGIELKKAKSAIRAERRASKREVQDELQYPPVKHSRPGNSPPPQPTTMVDPAIAGGNSQPMSRNASSSTNASNSDGPPPRSNGLSPMATRSRTRRTGRSTAPVAEKAKAPGKTMEKPKLNPQSTPARTTRSTARRDSTSSVLSSVDESIVNDAPPAPVTGAKRTAAEAGLPEENAEETARREKALERLELSRIRADKHPAKLSDIRSQPLPSSDDITTPKPNRETRSRKRPLDESEDQLMTPLDSPNADGFPVERSARPSAAPEIPKAKRVKLGGARTKAS
jgi:hypothetical protein